MSAYLSPGTYTVETAAATAGRPGDFQFSTKAGPAPWQPPEGRVKALTLSNGGFFGKGGDDYEWAEPCWSNTRSGRHARWYTFEVTEAMGRSQVTVTLKSERIHGQDHYWVGQGADTYLYLRGGRNFTGWAIAENDDGYQNHPEGLWWMRRRGWHWTASAVDRVWLEPGTYTIEATNTADGLRLQENTGPFSITFQRMNRP